MISEKPGKPTNLKDIEKALASQAGDKATAELADATKAQTGLQMSQHDLEAQKADFERIRKELQEFKDKYLSILANVSRDAIIATDKDLCIINWNKAAETLFGWTAEEVLGKRASPGIRAKILSILTDREAMKAITEKGSWIGEITIAKKDGSQIKTSASSGIFWDSSGNFNGILIIHYETPAPVKKSEIPALEETKAKAKPQADDLNKAGRPAKPKGPTEEQHDEIKVKDKGEPANNDTAELQLCLKELTSALEKQIDYLDKHTAAMEKLNRSIKQLEATIKKEIKLESQQPSAQLKEALTGFVDYNINSRYYQDMDIPKLPSPSVINHTEPVKKPRRRSSDQG
jgi:PAS domain S-box-containing protein